MEIWKDIKGYEGLYQISNLGRVKSLEKHDIIGRKRKEIIRKLTSDKEGYLNVNLSDKNGIRKKYRVNRLVAIEYLPNPNNLEVVNHKSETKNDNRVENLEWCSKKYNNCYGSRLIRVSKKNSKKVSQYDLQGNLIKIYKNSKEAAKSINGNKGNITQCCKGRYKTSNKFIWKYTQEE